MLDTPWQYTAAVGRRLVLTAEAIRDRPAAQENAKRARVAKVNICVSIA